MTLLRAWINRRFTHQKLLLALTVGCACCIGSVSASTGASTDELAQQLRAIDADEAADVGVYVKHLGTGEEVSHKGDNLWYLSSTVKVPLAIAVLQAVEDGRLALDDTLVLKESDYVDGAGDLLWHKPGTRLTVSSLLEKSIENSDSVATDMLMRHLGVDAFNKQIQKAMVPEGFEPFTTILQVRYDAYAELHPRADELSNMDYVEIRSAGGTDARVKTFMRKLDLDADALQVKSLEDAFRQYYEQELNSGTLVAFGELLERLVKGELLNEEHTERLLKHMSKITTGDYRLQAGLPDGTRFAQKTGTQIERACNVGVANPHSEDKAVVITACVEDFGDIVNAEQIFQQIAEAIERAGWL